MPLPNIWSARYTRQVASTATGQMPPARVLDGGMDARGLSQPRLVGSQGSTSRGTGEHRNARWTASPPRPCTLLCIRIHYTDGHQRRPDHKRMPRKFSHMSVRPGDAIDRYRAGAAHARRPVRSQVGKWVLADRRLRLLSIGDCLYDGAALRPTLSSVARRAPLPAMREAASSGTSTLATVGAHGHQWDVIVFPVRGPRASVHAVQACYVHGHDAPAWPPLVGAWEWDLREHHNLRTSWTPDMFKIYGIVAPPGRDCWEAQDWLQLHVRGGYPQISTVLARFLDSPHEQLITHAFRFRRPDTGQCHALRLAGSIERDEHGRALRLRGITTRVDGYGFDLREREYQQDLIDAATTLSPLPFVIVDLDAASLCVIGTPWRSIGLREPVDQALTSVVHPDDFAALAAFLASSPLIPTHLTATTQARFASSTGWISIHVTAVRLKVSDGRDHTERVMVRLGPAASLSSGAGSKIDDVSANVTCVQDVAAAARRRVRD